MKRIISFSLWGENSKYILGAIENVKLAKIYYPEWTCRFYVDENFSPNAIETLKEMGSEIITKKITHQFEPYMWRFLAAADSDVMISRDCDSRIIEREKVAVEEWLNSDKDFHIIRDYLKHDQKILAGTWGVRNGLLKNIEELMKNWKHLNMVFNDQMFLSLKIYPLVKDKAFIHDEYGFFKDENSIKINFPINEEYHIGSNVKI